MPYGRSNKKISQTHMKKSGFKMGGMDFGNGAELQRSNQASMAMQGTMSNPLMKIDDNTTMLDEVKLMDKKDTKLNKLTKRGKFDEEVNEKGYITKSKSGINLFGRQRNVTKYYDPETGEKLGKVVDVARGKGDPRPNKQKIKKVNPGLTQSASVGKIRLGKNIWEGGDKTEDASNLNREQYADFIGDKNSGKNEKTGKYTLPSYRSVFDNFENKTENGVTVKYNPRNKKTYADSDAGYSEFANTDAEGWWDTQADIVKNDKLRDQDQPEDPNYVSPNKYGRNKSFAKKRKPYKMKRYKK